MTSVFFSQVRERGASIQTSYVLGALRAEEAALGRQFSKLLNYAQFLEKKPTTWTILPAANTDEDSTVDEDWRHFCELIRDYLDAETPTDEQRDQIQVAGETMLAHFEDGR